MSENIAFLEASLQELRKKRDDSIQKMDELYLVIKEKTPDFVQKWISEQVEQKIATNFDSYNTLSTEQRVELKKQVTELIQKIPDETNLLFDDLSFWPHHKPYRSVNPDYNYEMSHIQEMIITLINPLGEILQQYKLTKGSPGEQDIWYFYIPQDKPKLNHHANFSFPNRVISEQFRELYSVYTKAETDISSVEKKLKGAQALEDYHSK